MANIFAPLVGLLHWFMGVDKTPILFAVYAVAGIITTQLTMSKRWYRLSGVSLSVMVWWEVSLFLPQSMPLFQRYVVSCLIGFVLGFAAGPLIVRLEQQDDWLDVTAARMEAKADFLLKKAAEVLQEQLRQRLYEASPTPDTTDDDRRSLTTL